MKPNSNIPFNKPFIIGKELYYIAQAVLSGHLAGDGVYTKKCHEFLEKKLGAKKVLLTHSCTAALEMSALLVDIQKDDEVILPSFTFVTTANAFYLRGAKLKFVDIRPDTLNIDEEKIKEAITERTKVIVPVHYAGVGCNMDAIMSIADAYKLFVVEDAAQAVSAQYKGKNLGTIGHLGTFSFHETKNFISGEGGALVVNDEQFIERAEIIREKGTNRSKFFRGEVDKYRWVDVGSSYLPSELVAAFLYAQLENVDRINKKRREIFDHYFQALLPLEEKGDIKLPVIPEECSSNDHMFYMLVENEKARDGLIAFLKKRGIHCVFHYIPLHLSPVGESLGYRKNQLEITESISEKLLRLPFYFDLSREDQDYVIKNIYAYFHP